MSHATTSEEVMIRFRLRSPASSGPAQPSEAVVWLDARYSDEMAQLHVDGEPALAGDVRAALAQAEGQWARDIGEHTTPMDIAVAMRGAVMQPFAPVLIEGQRVLEHRQPPDASPAELAEKLAGLLARDLITLPVEPVAPRAHRGEIVVGNFAERLFEWSYWRPTQPSAEAAALDLAPRLQAAAVAAIDELTDSLASADEQRRRAGRPAVGERLLRWPVEPSQWLPIAREIVAAFDAASDADPVALTHDFQRRMAELRIGR